MARLSISRIFTRLAATDPERVVVIADDGRLTAAELERDGTRWAHALIDAGVRPDELVTVSLSNGAAFVAACVGIWKAGATPQPLSPRLTVPERDAVLAVAQPAAVIGFAAPGRRNVALSPEMSRVRDDRGRAAPELIEPPELPDLWAHSWKAPTSSGSTGRPKVVLAAAPALLDPEVPVSPFLPLGATQLVAGPLTHSAVFTYAFRGLMTGHKLVILPRFDERRWLAAVAEHRVTWAQVVPTMMHRLLRLPEHAASDLSSLETVLHIGSPCAPELKRAFLDWVGPERVVEVYAGSESNGLTMIRGDEWLAHPGSVGRPIGGTEVRIVRDDGADAAVGEPGEVWLRRGETAAYRYLGADSRRTAGGWDTLGDLGVLDAEGYLYLLERARDVIDRGGEKVYPAEIERVLERHPAVRGAVAYGVPDAEYGQVPEALVDIGDAGDVDAAVLLAFAGERLAPGRRPARLHLVREPLRDDAGKISRGRLSEQAAQRG